MKRLGFGLVVAFSTLAACAGGESIDTPATVSDTGTETGDSAADDTRSKAEDSAVTADSGTLADSSSVDAMLDDSGTADSGVADTAKADTTVADTTVADTGTDAGWKSTEHVHIYIDNFCKVTTSPTSFTVPAGETLQLSYHNHSVDYTADVWMMYAGGYLDLAKGGTWNETYKHCFGPAPSTGYADISIAGGGSSACPKVRLYINCK